MTTRMGAAALCVAGIMFCVPAVRADAPEAAPKAALKYEVLHRFTGGTTGAFPRTPLHLSRSGALYGASMSYGPGTPQGAGTVFKLTPPASSGGKWDMDILYAFGDGADGRGPTGSLVVSKSGVVYGVTEGGGNNSGQVGDDGGTAFRISSGGTKTIQTNFGAQPGPRTPLGGLVKHPNGKFYGTTNSGGEFGFGTVFEMNAAGDIATLHSFGDGTDGTSPWGAIAIDSDGSLYGTTRGGGTTGWGTVFQLKNKGATFAYKRLYNFDANVAPYAGEPMGELLIDKKGVLYGMTRGSVGIVFKLKPPKPGKKAWKFETIHALGGVGLDGAYPEAGLVMDKKGVLYGAAKGGGSGACVDGCGTVFKLTPSKNGKTYKPTVLHKFKGGLKGFHPVATLVLGPGGAIYGTTFEGGKCSQSTTGCGVIFKLSK